MGTLGIQIGASTRPGDLAEAATRAESLGFSEIWLAEDYFELGGIASALIALAATETIPVGLGVVAASVRHPAVSAMEFATVGGAYPERFMAGLGHGSPGWVRQMGLEATSPMGLLREATEAIRRLLAGDTVSTKGDYFELVDVALDHPPRAQVPLYYGVHGPASLRLSGELADGTLLGWLSSPGYVAWARERIEEGRERGSRDDEHQLAVLCLLSMSDSDPEGSSRELVAWAAPMLRAMAGGRQLGLSTEGMELTEFVASVADDDLVSTMPLDLLRQFAATGRTDDVAGTIAGLLEAGADRVVLVPNPAGFRSTGAMLEQMEMARSLLPG
jgi:alkanesulfonate monooxygenase SsuD/methylene tetrahydromethanopterin reductase-like flavin-dependent oxidoreductase (luciferase family)